MKKERNYKKLYDFLVQTDEITAIHNGMTGDWAKDKNKFIALQTVLENSANIIEVDEYTEE